MKKSLHSRFALACGLLFTAGLFAQTPTIDFPQPSPGATVKQRVGLTDIEVTYSRPGVKGRVIFGNLVPYDEVWRTGANTATKISFSTAVNLGGKDVPAGDYALYSIPDKDSWTIILNKVTGQWGAYAYSSKNDFARIKAAPVALAEPVETFEISVGDIKPESASLNLTWEKTRVSVPITVDTKSTLVPQIEKAMAAGGDKAPYFQAAMYYYENDLDLKKAATWMDAAIAANPKAYYMIYRKGLILAKAGDKAGAIAAAKQSIEIASKDSGAAKEEYLRLNQALIDQLK
jgi:Protein of unknown function (DUF2911)